MLLVVVVWLEDEWDVDAAGTVCLLISLLTTGASASLRRTELELDDEAVFTSALLEVEVFRLLVPLLLAAVVVVVAATAATFFGGSEARFSSA